MGVVSSKYWYGDGDGDQGSNLGLADYDDTGGGANSNWRSTADSSGCDAPKDGDTVFFDNRAYLNTALGTSGRYQDLTNGDLFGHPNLVLLYVASNFNGNIATSGAPLKVNISSGTLARFIYQGTGVVYVEISEGAAAASACDELTMNSDGGYLYIKAEVNDATWLSEITKIIAFDGYLQIANEADADTIYVNELIMAKSTVQVDIGSNVQNVSAAPDVFVNILQIAGILNCDSGFNNYDGYGGTFNWGTSNTNAPADSDVDCYGYMKVYEDCAVYVAPKNTGTANLLQFFAYGGTIDASLALNAGIPKSIGSVSDEISEIWPGATVKLNNGNGNISFLGSSAIQVFGGTLEPAFNQQVVW